MSYQLLKGSNSPYEDMKEVARIIGEDVRMKPKLLKSFTKAGNYTWTVPEGVTKVRVAMIGGGAGGDAMVGSSNVNGVSGGGSGFASFKAYDVSPGEAIAITVGAGGPGGKQTGDGINLGSAGGISSFKGNSVWGGKSGGNPAGGQGGGRKEYPDALVYSGVNEAWKLAQPIFGGILCGNYTGMSFSPGVLDAMIAFGVMPFVLCSGSASAGWGSYDRKVAQQVLPNGNLSSGSETGTGLGARPTATKGTDPGCGGSMATTPSQSSGYTNVATASAGCDGGVFIYLE